MPSVILPNIQEIKKVAAYCRVSTSSTEQLNSYKNQKLYFEEMANKMGNMELVHIYGDPGTSGVKLLERKEFSRMLVDAGLDIIEVKNENDVSSAARYFVMANSVRKPKFNAILVKDTSRLARNVAVESIISELNKKDVEIVFLDINKSTKDSDAFIIINLLQVIAHQESIDKSNKVRFGIEQGIKQNRVAGRPPYGYKMNTETNCLIAIPEEAEVVKYIFSKYADGIGERKIRNLLAIEGYKARNGKYFTSNSINGILKNAKYCGINQRNKYASKGLLGKVQKVDKSSWQEGKSDCIEPIISEELFYKCEELRGTKTITQKCVGRNQPTSEFGGLIVCCTCGSKYNSGKINGIHCYICRNRKLHGKSICSNAPVYIDTIEHAIASDNYSVEIFALKSIMLRSTKKPIRLLEKKLSDTNKDNKVNLLQEEKQHLILQRKQYEELFVLRGGNDKSDISDKIKNINEEIETLDKRITLLKKSEAELQQDIADIWVTIKDLENYKIKETYTRAEIIEDIAKIIAYPDGNIKIIYKTEQKFRDICSRHHELSKILQEEQRHIDIGTLNLQNKLEEVYAQQAQ